MTSALKPILMAIATAAVLMAAAVSPAFAEKLSGGDIKDLVDGKRIFLKVPLGGEFPLYYQSNGQVTGDGTSLGLGKYFAPKETGRWFVKGNELCQQFPTWYDGKVSCFTLSKTGETSLQWRRDDGYSGRARIGG